MTRVLSCLSLLLLTTVLTADAAEPETKAHPILGEQMTSLSGEAVDLSKYEGRVLLIVNTASQCGATPQYGPLQKLHEKYQDQGLVVLGFPCNQFGGQEPGSAEEIGSFCQKNYGVTFPLFGKVNVKGVEAAPLFQYLTSEESGLEDTGPIGWNFEKFLVSRDGKVVARFRTPVKPDSAEVVNAIEAQLKQGS